MTVDKKRTVPPKRSPRQKDASRLENFPVADAITKAEYEKARG